MPVGSIEVGLFLQGDPRGSLTDYFDMAALSVASVRKHMPHAHVFHFTDAKTPGIEGVDQVIRIEQDMPMAVRRMQHNANARGKWLFMDVDIIVQRDVSDVFDEPFDVALTDREGTVTYEGAYAERMPFNLGVSFSRSPAFWQLVLRYMRNMPLKLQNWTGDQLCICDMIRAGLTSGFNIKTLPGLNYNYPPKHAGDGEHAALCHYKGPVRKLWILPAKETA